MALFIGVIRSFLWGREFFP